MEKPLLASLRQRARLIKRDTLALYLACKDPRTPWYAKAFAAAIVAYAFSPIDLIPDFVPVLGYLDDVVIIPSCIVLAIKLIPLEVLADARAHAQRISERPINRGAAAVIVAIWLLAAALVLLVVARVLDLL